MIQQEPPTAKVWHWSCKFKGLLSQGTCTVFLCRVFLHQSLADLVPLCNFVFASLNCSFLFGIYQLERVSLSYIETVSHFWRRGEWRAYMILPSPKQSGFHQDQKLNHVLEIHLATFSCVYDTGSDSYCPISITLSIAKFVSVKSSISNTRTVTENLYWNVKFVCRAG